MPRQPTIQTTRLSIPFTPRPWQAEVARELATTLRSVLNVQLGGGKTMLVVTRLIQAALSTKKLNGKPARFAYVGMSIQHAKQTVWTDMQFL